MKKPAAWQPVHLFSRCGAVVRRGGFSLQLTNPSTIALTKANAAQNIRRLSDLARSIHTPPLFMQLQDRPLTHSRKNFPCCIAAKMWKIVPGVHLNYQKLFNI